jgi:hypothetical protein
MLNSKPNQGFRQQIALFQFHKQITLPHAPPIFRSKLRLIAVTSFQQTVNLVLDGA